MGFASGSLSFRRFAVIGEMPTSVDESMLEKLASHALKSSDDSGSSVEIDYGWSGGRHVFDGTFSFEHNVFADAISFGLRVDTNKVPGDIKNAYKAMEEDAVAASNPSGFISKQQKRDVKDVLRRKVDADLRSGKFRRSKLIPILWDLPTQTLFSPASGSSFEQLAEIFNRTFDVTLEPISAGSLAMTLLQPRGNRRDYEDFRPTRFISSPQSESDYPEYPWTAKGPQPKDFLGNEFVMWLWHEAEIHDGVIEAPDGNHTIFFDRSIDLDCAYAQSGRDSLRGEGPTRMPEARAALRSGKVPRKAGLTLHTGGQEYRFTLNAETLGLSTLNLPEVEEAESPRVLFEERIALLRDVSKAVDSMFGAFLKERAGSGWETHTSEIRRWIQKPGKLVAAVA